MSIIAALLDTGESTCKLIFQFLHVEIVHQRNDDRDRLNGSWGIADIADCASAAKALAARGSIDGARTAIRGGSAGGFTALAALTQPATLSAFTAGTSLYGISDLTRLAKAGTHKFELRYMDKLMGGTVEEIPRVYAERSPVNNAQNIRTPLLVSWVSAYMSALCVV